MATSDFERQGPRLASPLFGDNKMVTLNSTIRGASPSEVPGATNHQRRRWQQNLARLRNKETFGTSLVNNTKPEPLTEAQRPVSLTAREIGGGATEAKLKRIRQLQNEMARKRRENGGNNTYLFRTETGSERAELAQLNSECRDYQSRFAKDFETQAERIRREKERRRKNGKTK